MQRTILVCEHAMLKPQQPCTLQRTSIFGCFPSGVITWMFGSANLLWGGKLSHSWKSSVPSSWSEEEPPPSPVSHISSCSTPAPAVIH